MNLALRQTSLLAVILIGLVGLYGSELDHPGCDGSPLPCGLPDLDPVPDPGIDPLPIPAPLISVDDRGNGIVAYALDRDAIVHRLLNATEFAAAQTVGTGVEEDIDVVVARGRARLAWRGIAGSISAVDGDAQTGLFEPQIELVASAADDPVFANGLPDTVDRSFLGWRAASTGNGPNTTLAYGTGSLTLPTVLSRYAENEDVDRTGLFQLQIAASAGRAVAVWTARAASDSFFVHVYAAVAVGGSWSEAHRLARVPQGAANVRLAVDMDGDGNAMVIWPQSGSLVSSEYSATFDSWREPAVVQEFPGLIRALRIDVASNGRAIAAWEVINGGVWVASYRRNETDWVGIQRLDIEASQPLNGTDIRVGIDRLGNARAVWRADSSVYASELRSDGWSAAESLGVTESPPDLDMNEEGFGVAVWWNEGLQSRLWDPAFGLDARFSSSSEPIVVGVGTPFDASDSSGPFAITRYEWDWDNDGTFDSTGGPVLSHVFATPGEHTVRLQVTDSTSRTATTTRTVTVNPVGEVTSLVSVNYRGPGDGAFEIRSAQPGFVPVRCETTTPPGNPADVGTCSATVIAGYEIAIVAERDPTLSTFSGWSQDLHQCNSVGNTTESGIARSECQFVADSVDRPFEVSFSDVPPPNETLTIRMNGFSQGGGRITSIPDAVLCGVQNQLIQNPIGGPCVYTFARGQTITVRAEPGLGMAFLDWEGCDSEPSANECVLTMNRPREIYARFSGG